MADRVGRELDNYRLAPVIGKGGFSIRPIVTVSPNITPLHPCKSLSLSYGGVG